MSKEIRKKMIATLLLTIMFISNIIQFFPLLESNAASIGDSIYIESIGTEMLRILFVQENNSK